MGFAFTRPIPRDFYNPKTGYVDTSGFREDLRGKLITEHTGVNSGISTAALAKQYYKQDDLEACLTMENELQWTRYILLSRGIILRNSNHQWHIVDNAIEAHDYLSTRTMRIIRAHQRTRVASEIAVELYPELADYSIPKALESMDRQVSRLEEAVQKDKRKLSDGKEKP